MKIGIVLLYGLYNPARSDYKAYLDFISQKILEEKLEELILCGGFTDPKQTDKSEASTAKEYLSFVTKNFDGYALEDRSLTTNQNLEFASEKINQNDELVVFCDLIRLAKVIWISQHFLLKESFENIYKSLFDFAHNKQLYKPFIHKNLKILAFDFPGKSKEETIAQSFAALIDVMALYDKEFDKMDLEQRKKDFGLS